MGCRTGGVSRSGRVGSLREAAALGERTVTVTPCTGSRCQHKEPSVTCAVSWRFPRGRLGSEPWEELCGSCVRCDLQTPPGPHHRKAGVRGEEERGFSRLIPPA